MCYAFSWHFKAYFVLFVCGLHVSLLTIPSLSMWYSNSHCSHVDVSLCHRTRARARAHTYTHTHTQVHSFSRDEKSREFCSSSSLAPVNAQAFTSCMEELHLAWNPLYLRLLSVFHFILSLTLIFSYWHLKVIYVI